MDINSIRNDFPILQRKIRGKQLNYLDNAATSQKPLQVIEAMSDFLKNHNSNIHRANHTLSNEATEIYEEVRDKIRRFVNAPDSYDIIFTKNGTEAINLVAQGIMSIQDSERNDYVTTIIEHHANFVPWQQYALRNHKSFNVIPTDYSDLSSINENTAIVASTMASNITGEVLDYHSIIRQAKSKGAITLLDAAQSTPHMLLDINDTNADFYAFSAHKMLGPTGLGVLVGKKELLDRMRPFIYGGEMISEVEIDNTNFQKSPHRFEAGTMPLMEVAGLREGIDYLNDLGKSKIRMHSQKLSSTIKDHMAEVEKMGVRRILSGNYTDLLPIVSLYHPTVHHNDIGLMLDSDGIAVRTGHHCAMPFIANKKIEGTLRASAYIYNTEDEINNFFSAYKNSINKLK